MLNYSVAEMPADEQARQSEVDALELAKEDQDDSFEKITRLLANVVDVPITAFTVIDRTRQFFRASEGLSIRETPRDVSFCSHAILQDEILEVGNALEDQRFAGNPLVTGDPHIRFYAGIPVHASSGRKVGTLCAIDRRPRQLAGKDRQALTDLRDLIETELRLRASSMQDHMTGLANRRQFDLTLNREWRRAKRANTTLGTLIIDVDHFKRYNDAYGHIAGDDCLISVAEALDECCNRAGDLLARFGGEEFAVVTAPSNLSGLEQFAEKLRSAVEFLAIPHPDSVADSVTVSIGAALATDSDDFHQSPEWLLREADKALYRAKRSGRNRVAFQEDGD